VTPRGEPERACDEPAGSRKRLGFFTRVLDRVDAADRYRLAIEQITRAEALGYDSAWVAQHHFREDEGGLPSPFVFLSNVAARTSRLRLGTGVVTLPLENPIRVAEDAAVLDLLCGGRLDVGFGSGGTPSAFKAFVEDSAQRDRLFEDHLQIVLDAWRGSTIGASESRLYPAAPGLWDRVWHATFSVRGGARAGAAGAGLMLSRTQPRPSENPAAKLWDIQNPIIDAYLDTLGARPRRILGSRSVFVTENRSLALELAAPGLARAVKFMSSIGQPVPTGSIEDVITAFDIHIGTPRDVVESLKKDPALARVTDLAFQVHPVDPPHHYILRSLELVVQEVATALGWVGPTGVHAVP
jgi:putative FMN-dependent luciferase-like monooxygenase